jgi:lysophospholipase L1-like esterase
MVLKDKAIAFLGDSITEGVGVADLNNRYDNVLKRECGLRATYNYGISGTRLAHQIKPSEKPRYDLCFCGRAYDLNRDADIIVVYGGVNDYLHGDAPFGQFGDATPATFCGGVRFLMNLLKTEYEGKTVVFLTPARLCYDGMTGDKPANRASKGADAQPLPAYIDIIKRTAAELGIPAFDMYADLGIDPTQPDQWEKFTADGLHFNDAGHYVIAQKLKVFLQTL